MGKAKRFSKLKIGLEQQENLKGFKQKILKRGARNFFLIFLNEKDSLRREGPGSKGLRWMLRGRLRRRVGRMSLTIVSSLGLLGLEPSFSRRVVRMSLTIA